MSDEKSLAVAYGIKRRSRKGELTHEAAPTPEELPRKTRLKAMLMADGGEVPEETHDYTPEDLEFPEEPIFEAPEETPEMKRKNRLKELLSQD